MGAVESHIQLHPVQSSPMMGYTGITMDALILLVYRTPTGRTGRRHVRGSALHATIAQLTRKGYSGFVAL